jgi:uncharacterized protein YjiS (DUF1127 family)
MYCGTSHGAIDLLVLRETTMSKTSTSHVLTALSSDRSLLARLACLLTLWRKRLRWRHELSVLTAEQMRDTGLNPELVKRQSRKPFWKA